MAALPEVQVLPIVVDKQLLEIKEVSQVIVHCHLDCNPGLMVRIWRTTFLYPEGSSSRIPLVHAENISYAPIWTPVPNTGLYRFTLVFNGLPRDCQSFDLVEEIGDDFFPFSIFGIPRTESDVYSVWI